MARIAIYSAVLTMVGVAGFAAGWIWPAREASVLKYLEQHPAFLVDHPQLIEASRPVAAARIDGEARARRRDLLRPASLNGVHGGSTPRWGSADAELGFVEFTDYGCLPCKVMAAAVEYAAASNPDRQVVIAYLPLDGASEYAARAGLAAWAQDPQKFRRFHRELMGAADATSPAAIEQAAARAGLDLEKMQAAIADPGVRIRLAEMRDLATRVGVRGLPSIVVADGSLITGPATAERLDGLLRNTRQRGP